MPTTRVQPSLLIVLQWATAKIEEIGNDQKSSIDSLSDLVTMLSLFVRATIRNLDPHWIEGLWIAGISSINCETNWRVRSLGLQVLRHFERIFMGPPLELLPKIIDILLNDCEENSTKALKFFIVLASTRTGEFMAFKDVLFSFCVERLTEIEGPSRFSDMLVAILLYFPLSPELLGLILAHFPVLSSRCSFQSVYRWALAQLRENTEAVPILLNSIIRLFCLNLATLSPDTLSQELLIELVVTLDSVQADHEGHALLEHLLVDAPALCFMEGVESVRTLLNDSTSS
jgi:hypothetical protein